MKEVMYIPGDLVMYGNKATKVRECRGNYYVLNCQKVSEDAVHYTNIAPIPLSPAILNDNGWEISIIKDKRFWDRVSTEENIQKDSFVDNSIARIAVKNKIALMFMGSSPNVFFFELSHMVVKVEYCHQLQHFLFGLGLPSDLKV